MKLVGVEVVDIGLSGLVEHHQLIDRGAGHGCLVGQVARSVR
jgi:hypothetical protein